MTASERPAGDRLSDAEVALYAEKGASWHQRSLAREVQQHRVFISDAKALARADVEAALRRLAPAPVGAAPAPPAASTNYEIALAWLRQTVSSRMALAEDLGVDLSDLEGERSDVISRTALRRIKDAGKVPELVERLGLTPVPPAAPVVAAAPEEGERDDWRFVYALVKRVHEIERRVPGAFDHADVRAVLDEMGLVVAPRPVAVSEHDTDREGIVSFIEEVHGRWITTDYKVDSFRGYLADAMLAAGYQRVPEGHVVVPVGELTRVVVAALDKANDEADWDTDSIVASIEAGLRSLAVGPADEEPDHG